MSRSSRRRRVAAAVVGVLLLPVGAHAVAADRAPRPRAQVMAGGDFGVVARSHGGPVQQATGSFVSGKVSNVTSVTSPVPTNTPTETKDAYTLQLNTNEFTTPLCAGKPLCRGWMQFVFANNGASGAVYIKYWLRSYGVSCPAGWLPKQIQGVGNCYKKSSVTSTPTMPLTTSTMAGYRLTGTVNGPNDIAVFTHGTTPYPVSSTRELAVGPEWRDVEFNVYGYDDESSATFNAGADFYTRIELSHAGTARPTCESTGFSNEYNNLSFVAPDPLLPVGATAVVFHQRKLGTGQMGVGKPCASALTGGETHERTFAGTEYDFQATGDFVEAQVGSGFEVQTRKGAALPTYPNGSVNRSVATRMGATQVAVCDGPRLMVDGVLTDLPPGGSLSLPSGVDIRRATNAYNIEDQAGNSLVITSNTSSYGNYFDMDIGLATWPTPVRGLLGNPDNNPTLLEARDGTRFPTPVSFSDLYTRYGNSWRVSSTASLLRPCSQAATGNPSVPFFAGDLSPSLRIQSENVCRQARVLKPIWLEACTLDVAVLGPRAAALFIDRQPDVIDGNPPRRPPCNPAGCSGGGR